MFKIIKKIQDYLFDRPTVDLNGSKEWYKNGQLHREGDEPAYIYADGSKCWYKND